MGFKCGIVGLPNVGKSTLFNALTSTANAAAANYPFCTIEPNIGRVPVPDERLDKLAEIVRPETVAPTQLDFVDIAGLVRGASKGEGLGNQFLANIREVDAIVHVLRCFEDDNIAHVDDRIDPISDAATVETELLIADLDSLERQFEALQRKARGGDKEALARHDLTATLLDLLREGIPARDYTPSAEDKHLIGQLGLLTAKPVLYICNVEESAAATGNGHTTRAAAMAGRSGAAVVTISAAIEAEIAALDNAGERADFLADIGLEETGLAKVIQAGYQLLNLITFFTAGPKEVRAWTVANHATAPEAAGVIHTDFERGFIRAETISYRDFVSLGGEQAARDAGKLRAEGKDYKVRDGDVLHFLFNV